MEARISYRTIFSGTIERFCETCDESCLEILDKMIDKAEEAGKKYGFSIGENLKGMLRLVVEMKQEGEDPEMDRVKDILYKAVKIIENDENLKSIVPTHEEYDNAVKEFLESFSIEAVETILQAIEVVTCCCAGMGKDISELTAHTIKMLAEVSVLKDSIGEESLGFFRDALNTIGDLYKTFV